MAVGTVKVWSKGNGFGWIMPDSGGSRVYVHKSGVIRRDPERAAWLEVGEKVEYQIGQRPKGLAAVNVKPYEAKDSEG
jgi:cold shock CspA family protein